VNNAVGFSKEQHV